MTGPPNRPVKTVDTAAEILSALETSGKMTLREIANSIDCAESTTHRHLATLEHNEFIVREGGQYRLSFRFLEVGGKLRDQHPLFKTGREYADQLAEETDERIWLSTIENAQNVSLYWTSNRCPLHHHSRIGSRYHLHVNANGKVTLAELPDEEVTRIIQEHGLPRKTDQTITDEDRLFEELETVREQGYAVSHGEYFEGMTSVAVPIAVAEFDVLGAIGVGFPTDSKSSAEQEEIVKLLTESADDIALQIRVE